MWHPWKWSSILFCCLFITGCSQRNFTEEAIQRQITTTSVSATSSEISKTTTERTPISTGELVDLTILSSTMVYSEVFNMINDSDSYIGKTIRATGNFSYYQDPTTKKEYFAIIVQDALGCCAQGIEFVLQGEHCYPQDYPELESEITIEGTFSTYTDDTGTYIQLQDAVLE